MMITRDFDNRERNMGICRLPPSNLIFHEGILSSRKREVGAFNPPYVSNQDAHLAFLGIL